MKKNNKKNTETKSVKSDTIRTEIVETKEVAEVSTIKHFPTSIIGYDLDTALTKRQQVALVMFSTQSFDMDIKEAFKMADEFLSYK